jgi:hypothetical protein
MLAQRWTGYRLYVFAALATTAHERVVFSTVGREPRAALRCEQPGPAR